MKERPILFSGPMVRAILAGTKTQTRRVLKPQPVLSPSHSKWAVVSDPWHEDAFAGTGLDVANVARHGARRQVWWSEDWCGNLIGEYGPCPHGIPGERLWVRETWRGGSNSLSSGLHFRADLDEQEAPGQWKPSILMPRWASRITLEVTEVRVQRVQEISGGMFGGDARAEGLEWVAPTWGVKGVADSWNGDPRESYRALWDSINAKRGFGWDSDPWVWAITFRRLA